MRAQMNYIRIGAGKPLLLIHGLGGSWKSWTPILDELAKKREVYAVDLPGFGDTPALDGEVTIESLANELTKFIVTHNLIGVDVVGSSMGARLVLELVRRGSIVGAAIALNPGGFWNLWEKNIFYASISLSLKLVKLLQPLMQKITSSKIGRKILLSQFSANPGKLEPSFVLQEMRDYARAQSTDELLFNLTYGKSQEGSDRVLKKPLVIGWGDKDNVCFSSQSKRALRLFPQAKLHILKDCGHFPQWDKPQETIQLILGSTSTYEYRLNDKTDLQNLLNVLEFKRENNNNVIIQSN